MGKRDRGSRPVIVGTSRLEGLTDGVIAITMTLLVLALRLPALPSDPTTGDVLHALGDVAPKFIAFTVSFFWVAIVWVNHHHIVAKIERTDATFLWLNIILLFFLALVPFTTAMIGDHPTVPIIVSLYAVNDALVAGAWTAWVSYAFSRRRLTIPSVPKEALRREGLRGAGAISAYVVGAVVALFFTPAALVLYALVPLAFVAPAMLGFDLVGDLEPADARVNG